MNLKLVVALCLFTAIPAVAYAQQNQPPAPPPPTLADVQKLVQTISADKAKLQIYCQLAKLNDQIAAADQKKDTKTMQTLSKQIDALEQKMGPDYAKLMDGLLSGGPRIPRSASRLPPPSILSRSSANSPRCGSRARGAQPRDHLFGVLIRRKHRIERLGDRAVVDHQRHALE